MKNERGKFEKFAKELITQPGIAQLC